MAAALLSIVHLYLHNFMDLYEGTRTCFRKLDRQTFLPYRQNNRPIDSFIH